MKLGFISDIHEDCIRLKEAFRILEKKRCAEIICLGDIVGFTLPFYKYINNRNAEECIKLIRENCSTVVSGNHDLYGVRKVPRFSSTFDYPENWYSLDYKTREKLSRRKIWLYEDSELPIAISDSSKEYLKNLPEFEIREIEKKNYFFSHFHFPDLTGSTLFFPTKRKHLDDHFAFTGERGCSFSFSGHGHPEGATIFNDKISHLKFGRHDITDDRFWIVSPCTAKTSRLNGVMTYSTHERVLEVIPIT